MLFCSTYGDDIEEMRKHQGRGLSDYEITLRSSLSPLDICTYPFKGSAKQNPYGAHLNILFY